MGNACGRAQGSQPEVKTLFVTLWDLSLPTAGDAVGVKREVPRNVEFPLIAAGAQVWVRAEGAKEWTAGPVAEAEAEERGEESQYVMPTVIDVGVLLPGERASRIEIGVSAEGLRGVQFGGYYETADVYVPQRDARRLVAVTQWGAAAWSEMYAAFADCANMQIMATDVPILSQCDSLHSAFMGSGVVEGFEGWNVGSVLDMTAMFYGCSALVGKSVAGWDVRNVESMAMMFMECESFDGQLGRWDVSNVQDVSAMFSGCAAFRGRGVDRWQIQEDAVRDEAFDGCFSLAHGEPEWMGGGSVDGEDVYADEREARSAGPRKFRHVGSDDD